MATNTFFNCKTTAKEVTSSSSSSPDTVYTCPTNFVSLVRMINLAAPSSDDSKVSLYWYEAATATHHYLLDTFDLPGQTTKTFQFIPAGAYIALRHGDKIQAFNESDSKKTYITLSCEEMLQSTQT